LLNKIKTISSNHGVKKYLHNTSWMFGEQILRMVAGLFVGIWVARYLGPKQFGIFNYAIAFTAIFGGIAKLGLDGIVIRELINHPENRNTYLGTSFWLKVFGGILTLGMVTITTLFVINNDANTNLFIFIIAAGLVFQSFEVIDFYFQSQVLAKFVSICRITQLVLSSVVKIYLVLTKSELLWFVLVSLFDQITLAISLAIAYRCQNKANFYKAFSFATAKKLLKDSWPLVFSSIVIMVYMRIDQIMIKEMLGVHAVGVYSAAVRLSEIWYFIPVIISSSLFPAIVNAKKVSEKLYYRRLQRLYTFMLWMAMGIAAPMTFFSEWLVVLLYGEAYRAAGQVLMIHIWTGVFVFLGVASGNWLLSENLQKIAFYRTFFGVVTNITLNFVLIPIYGLMGAAIAILIAQIMACFVFDAFSKRTRVAFFMKLKAINFVYLFRG
jgi:O-antigen/teichoic acid export membrane protein